VHYEIEVPSGVYPGQAFQANVGGVLMYVTCPEGAGPGAVIQIAGPEQSSSHQPVAGVPVGGVAGLEGDVVAAGYPVPNTMNMGRVYAADGVMGPPEVGFVEVDEISPAGWMCLIIGCFACPGLNLLGLCMRERRLVPVSQIY